MPWTRVGNQHVFVQHTELVARSLPTTSTESTQETNTATGSINFGSWVQWTGEPKTTQYWAENGASGKLNNAHGQVELAQPNSTHVAGVVTKLDTVKTDGIVLAWVIKKKRTLELSGLYSTTENGAFVANTAIIQRGNFFVMARSKDDELQKLMSQFAELTGT
jgi:hypothetical protein